MLAYELKFQSASAQADLPRLQNIVKDSDAIFFLTDTRESRLPPNVVARALGKTLIKGALGLDGWLVM